VRRVCQEPAGACRSTGDESGLEDHQEVLQTQRRCLRSDMLLVMTDLGTGRDAELTSDAVPSMDSTEYEKLTRLLVDRIAQRSPVTTTRLEHNVVLQGRATPHQVDVLWEFTTASEVPHRIIFECRHKGRNLEQNDALAFRGVVDEVGYDSVPTTGVMVHLTGYQRGAKKVADTYGVIILELRNPNDKDVAGRLMAIQVSFSARMPVVKDLYLDVSEKLSDALEVPVLNYSLEVEDAGGQRSSVMDLIKEGEINSLEDEVTPLHRVTRTFDPPAILMANGEPVAKVRALSATVGEEQSDLYDFTVGGRERLAWMVKDTLGGARAWFTEDGKIYLNES